ncbi:MAG: hypothetical protein GX654_15655 [Desulfatiglans sp.]|nr:hypothetical protein [Desulfatiglans sp.]
MKRDLRADSTGSSINKTFEIDPDTLIDIMERINGLSFEGQCEIVAYLKREIARGKNGLKPLQRYFEIKSIR